MSLLEGKRVIVLGERDGVAGGAIAACAEAAGAPVVFNATECFVWTSSGAMDLHHQAEVKKLAEEHGPENLVVVLGSPDPDSAKLYGETVVSGDPTFAGPLAEVQLGLDVYHVLEEEFRSSVPESIYDEQVGVMADVLDAESIRATMRELRSATAKG